MYREKSVAVVVPAYNEVGQVARLVIDPMPDIVDKIIIVNDCSKDSTSDEVRSSDGYRQGRVHLIEHEVNQGVGGAIATGYKWARDQGFDVAVVMAGDGQMNPADLPAILDPVVEGRTDYTKGNRLVTGDAYKKIPTVRFVGNSVLSLLTKIASGYWRIADSQTGYTAINQTALQAIDWDNMYKRYGQPNDLLVKLNVAGMRVMDVQSAQGCVLHWLASDSAVFLASERKVHHPEFSPADILLRVRLLRSGAQSSDVSEACAAVDCSRSGP
jgi:glycosyltransferase involved in cell wall biosynthesis